MFADAYFKIYLLIDGKRVAKHKTHVKRRNAEPIFNESFAFDLPSLLSDASAFSTLDDVLNATAIELLLLNHDGVTRSEIVGRCIIDAASPHWRALRAESGQQVAEWHVLSVQ